MKKINKHIIIVRSTVNGLSAMSQKSCDAILATLGRSYQNVSVFILNKPSDLDDLTLLKPDLVFIGMKCVPDDLALDPRVAKEFWVSEYLDSRGIPYTGSGRFANELERNKALAKQRVIESNLKTAPFFVVNRRQKLTSEIVNINFPLFVKPTDRGGGMGIDTDSVVHNFEQLKSKVEKIAVRYMSDSLVEEYLTGREFSVAILKDEFSENYIIMPLEKIPPIDKNGDRLLSGIIKAADSVTDAEVVDADLKQKITELALNVFQALGGRDYGRIDIRLDDIGEPHFLEANFIPSLIKGYGSFPKACLLNIDLDYEEMLLRIVQLAFERSTSHVKDTHEEKMFAETKDLIGTIV
ncbi:MAG TPA: ATP-grasp domain-containing protein [Candidatus Saccharibacteria bacterium]|nr:ATP-grasp domain-containing protein [Candidatus Saccharibacteria bacterium]